MSVRGILALLVVAVLAVFGWHVSMRDQVIQQVKEIPSIHAVDRAVPVKVEVNPFTNRVKVGLALAFAAHRKNLIASLGAEVGAKIATEYWPSQIDPELARLAREQWDLYAMAIPYRSAVID